MTLDRAVSNIAWTPSERICAYAHMADRGIHGLEIAPGLFLHAAEDPFRPSSAEKARALDEIADHGLHLVSIQSLLFGTEGAELFGDEQGVRAFRSGMERAIDLAGELGVPNLVFGSPRQRIIPSRLAHTDAEKHAISMFQELGERALIAGTRISLEPNPEIYGTNFLTSFAETLALVRKVSHPAIRLTCDIGALHATDDIKVLDHVSPSVGELIGHVHLSAAWLKAPSESSDHIEGYCRSLSASGYDGAFSLEMRTPEDGLRGVIPVMDRLAVDRGDRHAQ